jgi:hypothetical protein
MGQFSYSTSVLSELWKLWSDSDRLCGLVSEFLTPDPEVRIRFPALPRFFWQVVGLERGPLSYVEEKVAVPRLENREYGQYLAASVRSLPNFLTV